MKIQHIVMTYRNPRTSSYDLLTDTGVLVCTEAPEEFIALRPEAKTITYSGHKSITEARHWILENYSGWICLWDDDVLSLTEREIFHDTEGRMHTKASKISGTRFTEVIEEIISTRPEWAIHLAPAGFPPSEEGHTLSDPCSCTIINADILKQKNINYPDLDIFSENSILIWDAFIAGLEKPWHTPRLTYTTDFDETKSLIRANQASFKQTVQRTEDYLVNKYGKEIIAGYTSSGYLKHNHKIITTLAKKSVGFHFG
jgi:hypothetical protein